MAAGTVLAEIGEQGQEAGVRSQGSGVRRQETGRSGQEAIRNPQSAIRNPPISATPVAQRMAAEHGVDLARRARHRPRRPRDQRGRGGIPGLLRRRNRAPIRPIYQVPIYQLPPSASSRRPWDAWPRSWGWTWRR